MSTCGAWPEPLPGRRWPPFRLTSAHQPVGHGWPYWVLTATAVAVVAGARRVDRRAYSRTRAGCAPGGHPCRLGTDASAAERCFTRRASRPPGSGVGSGSGVARSRGVAATLRRCGHAGWNPALRFGAGLGGYSLPTRGTSPSRQRDQVLVLPVWRLPGNRSAPFSRSTAPLECARQQDSGFAACRRACPRHCVCPPSSSSGLAPGRHRKEPA